MSNSLPCSLVNLIRNGLLIIVGALRARSTSPVCPPVISCVVCGGVCGQKASTTHTTVESARAHQSYVAGALGGMLLAVALSLLALGAPCTDDDPSSAPIGRPPANARIIPRTCCSPVASHANNVAPANLAQGQDSSSSNNKGRSAVVAVVAPALSTGYTRRRRGTHCTLARSLVWASPGRSTAGVLISWRRASGVNSAPTVRWLHRPGCPTISAPGTMLVVPSRGAFNHGRRGTRLIRAKEGWRRWQQGGVCESAGGKSLAPCIAATKHTDGGGGGYRLGGLYLRAAELFSYQGAGHARTSSTRCAPRC